VRLHHGDKLVESVSRNHRARRIVRVRHAHETRLGTQPGGEEVEVEPPAVLEPELEGLQLGPDRARGFEVGDVVRRADEDVVADVEQRRSGDEERARGACGDEHIVGLE
jgi:hypothetical protein